MNVVFCRPELTMTNKKNANIFFDECKLLIENFGIRTICIQSTFQIDMMLGNEIHKDDIFIFFNSETGVYDEKFERLMRKYVAAQSRIWPIAMEGNKECRKPPEPVSERQSFDVAARNENRNPMKNNMKAIAQIFSRKIIAQTLSPLYRDEVLYFISHKRSDGEYITSRLADELKKLTRERNVYRDVVNVAVVEDAQKDIDKNLAMSDVLIFIQTEQAWESEWIMKELCYALVNDIPVLWIQIDDASYKELKIKPGDQPALKYASEEFQSDERLEEIANEIEENCFKLIMYSSNQVSSYIEYLNDLNEKKKIILANDGEAVWAYKIEYTVKTKDKYDNGLRKHYIQCFGRNPKAEDLNAFAERIKKTGIYKSEEKIFLLSNHGKYERIEDDNKILEENYEDYIVNLENVLGIRSARKNKRIIISGAFPDGDEIYKASLMEAVVVYAREIIKNGYTLVFGAHPTFQNLIFDIGKLYASDMKYSIEMHMDRHYIELYDREELEEKCSLVLSDSLQEMREKMVCGSESEMIICLGGRIKPNKSEQGVDIEIELAKKAGIPVAVVGSVGGRSGEYAFERIGMQDWSDLNPWGNKLNEDLFYNVNHRLMIRRLLDKIE